MRNFFFLFITFFLGFSVSAQRPSVFRLDSVPKYNETIKRNYGIALPTVWKFHKGDDTVWADPNFNDGAWQNIPTILNLDSLPKNTFENIGWFRLHLSIDSSLIDKVLGLMIDQYGASQIYVDGKLIHTFGKIDPAHPDKEERSDPKGLPVDIVFKNTTDHVIAIRYSHAKAAEDLKNNWNYVFGFTTRIGQLRDAVFFKYIGSGIIISIFIFYFTFFLALSFVHLMLFMYYKANKSNLYYGIFNAGFGTLFLFNTIQVAFINPDFTNEVGHLYPYLPDIYIPALLAMLYSIFNNNKLPKIFWFWFVLFAIDFVLTFFNITIPYAGILFNIIVSIEPLRIVITAWIKKKEGAKIIGVGIISTVVFFLLFFTLPFFTTGAYLTSSHGLSIFLCFVVAYFTLNIPLSMTLFLARDFAKTSRNLEKKLNEVEELSTRSLEQEKEKQKILEDQKDVLETQVLERTKEITLQKKVIEEKNKEVTDSINYAKRIQEAMLPPLSFIDDILSEAFVLYKPKDIVAGDFYWAELINVYPQHLKIDSGRSAGEGQSMTVSSSYRTEVSKENNEPPDKVILIAAADCTGHGVPGAMVSVVCSNALNRSVNEFGLIDPGKILDKTRDLVLETFAKSDKEVKDGMDISLCSIQYLNDSDKVKIGWSGANNPLWYIEKGIHKEITAHKQSIGRNDNPLAFPTHHLDLNKGDTLFLFTDGYADQFGGEKGKKFKYKQLLDLISSSNNLHMKEIKTILTNSFEKWKGELEQIDDVCIIGIRL